MPMRHVLEPWRDAPLPSLVEHLLEEYHLPTRRGLQQLDQLLRRVNTLHRGTHGALLRQLGEVFAALRTELEHHLGREEELLFPLVREGHAVTAGTVLTALDRDHVQTRKLLDRLVVMLDENDGAEGIPPPVATVLEGLRNLEESLREHMALEDELLFARIAAT